MVDEPPLLQQLSHEVFISLSTFLDARSLACLACAAAHFWRPAMIGGAGGGTAGTGDTTVAAGAEPPPPPRTSSSALVSLVEEAARLRVAALFSAAEQEWAPRCCSSTPTADREAVAAAHGGGGGGGLRPWLEVLHELEVLSRPRRFTRVGPRVAVCEGGLVALRSGVTCHAGHRAALCAEAVLRAGRHWIEFEVLAETTGAMVGVTSASFDPGSGRAACTTIDGRMLCVAHADVVAMITQSTPERASMHQHVAGTPC